MQTGSIGSLKAYKIIYKVDGKARETIVVGEAQKLTTTNVLLRSGAEIVRTARIA